MKEMTMQSIIEIKLTRCTKWILLCLAILLPPTSASAQDGGSRTFRPVLAELRNPAGHPLTAEQFEATTDALRRLASEAGIVLCYEDANSSTAELTEICPKHGNDKGQQKIHTLRWNVQARLFPTEDFQTLSLSLTMDIIKSSTKRHGRKGDWPAVKLLVTQTQIHLDEGLSPERQTLLTAKALYDLILDTDEIYDWLASLSNYPPLLQVLPAHSRPAAPESRFAKLELPEPQEMGPTPEQMRRIWEEEKEAIVDDLIEDRPETARMRAEDLLQENLPEDLAQRVEELLAKAREQIALQNPPEAEPKPAPEPDAAPAPSSEAQADMLDATFDVRYASPGSGFRGGIDGRLRISDRGIRFKPSDSANGDGWSVKWPTLKRAGKAVGVWDVAHPLVIETRDGDKYYLTSINQQGRYDKGDQILEYIEKGKKRG